MTETIAVLAVIGLLAAVAAPTMVHFIERGRQMNRTNIARTIYLAAQNRLTELRITKNLKVELTGEYYDGPVNGKYIEKSETALFANKNVYTSLDNYLPDAELTVKDDGEAGNGNEKYVHYINKAKGAADPDDAVIKLLDPVVMDKSILNDAILIEYNIRTGVVLSVFYGDTVSGAFVYDAENPDSSDPNNVFGTRGMDEGGYAYAEPRKQGYYGVEDTNTLEGLLEESQPTLIKVYDSYNPPQDASLSRSYANMLCAELLIPEKQLDGTFDLLINGEKAESGISFGKFKTNNALNEENGISWALADYGTGSANTALMYRYDGSINTDEGLEVPADQRYARIIWVLDYVGGDMAGSGLGSNIKHSIYVKYALGKENPLFGHDRNLRVGIQGDVTAASFNEEHPYFFTGSKSGYDRNQYTVMSARHLYNVRYVANGNFRQGDDIVLYAGAGIRSVENFAPIPAFTGTYTASYRVGGDMRGYVIRNLTVNVPGDDDVGLFKRIDGVTDPLRAGESRASVVGLTLENPSVYGRHNVGSVCGTLNGFITGIYVRYTDDADGKTAGGTVKTIKGTAGNVGGIVGENRGTVTDSTFLSPVSERHVSAEAGAAGGLAGYNNGGALKRAMLLALAPQAPNGQINPIIGTGAISGDNELYYLSGVAQRPGSPVDYNTEEANTGSAASRLGTAELYDTLSGGDWQNDDWQKALKGGTQRLTHEEAAALNNVVYPYPYSRFSATPVAALQTAAAGGAFTRAWPVVDGFGTIGLSNVAYYEQYKNSTYGLWFVEAGRSSLRQDQEIVEAGYVVVLGEKLQGHYFFADVDDTWDDGDSVRVPMTFEMDETAFAAGIAAAARAAGNTDAEIWSCRLPLDALSGIAKRSAPLHVMYTINSEGKEPQRIGYMQPLFAKGLYGITNPAAFYVRTPWQMRNIGVLTEADDTSGKTFTQELVLDYEHTGTGVNVSGGSTARFNLSGPAVSGVFQGTYQGKAIKNVTVTASSGNASLFATNQGVIKDIALQASAISANGGLASGIALANGGSITGTSVSDSEITGSNDGTAAGIAGTNSGTIADCEAVNVTVSGDREAGGVTLTNTGTVRGTSVTGTNMEKARITSEHSTAAGIAGTNSNTIENCKVVSYTVSGSEETSGVTLINTGLIKGASVMGTSTEKLAISSSNSTASGIAGINRTAPGIAEAKSGKIENCKVVNVAVSGNKAMGGVTLTNEGSVTGTSVENSTVDSQNESAAGVAVTNSGTISTCTVSGVTVSGLSASGGVAGENSGTILKTGVEKNSAVKSVNNAAGGIAGVNNGGGSGGRGVVESCTVSQTTVSGLENAGGAVGDNRDWADVIKTSVTDSSVRGTGGDHIGGIAGSNGGEVADCMVITVAVSNGVNDVGGVAGENSGTILKTGVEYSTVKGDKNTVGGIAGDNSGTITDVFFLSTASPENERDSRPVSDSGGGIAGTNSGDIMRALFIAPAPRSDSGGKATFYPVVRKAESGGTATDSFYLMGYRYSLNEGKSWTSGSTSLLYYNRTASITDTKIEGRFEGLVTRFIDKEWLAFIYTAQLDDWSEWIQPTTGYPYPILRNGMSVPAKWAETDSPIRPGQVDTDDWVETLPTSNRAENLGFVNGDFSAEFVRDPGVNVPTGGNNGGYTDNTWDSVDMDYVSGWYTRPVASKYNYFDIRNFSGNQAQKNYDGYYYYGPVKRKLIEFQEPNGKADFMPTDYKGQYRARTGAKVSDSPYRYVELNAQLEGTLYQVSATTPGAQFYYSFYHATNNYPKADSMSFYLTPIGDKEEWIVNNAADAAIRDNRMVLIRPCSSPRAQPNPTYTSSTSLPNLNRTLNPSAWNTVRYDPRSGDFAGFDLSYHNGRSYLQPDETKVVQNIPTTGNVFLYDVWIGDTSTTAANGGTRNGYGITFWSTTEVTLNTNGYSSISDIPSSVRTAARNNVIGYWGVEFGWKHYYGLYTVPEGQSRTEFAFQSNTANPEYGNYLDGISFKSPAFLSIDKYIKMGDTDVKFVKPGDGTPNSTPPKPPLTVELHINSLGEIKADSIVIKDRLAPFTEYIEFIPGSAKLNGSPVNASYSGGTVTITPPSTTRLNTDEALTVTFDIKVLEKVASSQAESDTLLYYFRNQAVVEYREDSIDNVYKLTGYKDIVHTNGSGPEPVQVFIDPIKLSKTVTTVGHTSGGDPLIDGPFEVTLTLENTLEAGNYITTSGLVSDVIPADFRLYDPGTLPIDAITGAKADIIQNDDGSGSTRIVIRNVGLDQTNKKVEYNYKLEYTGKDGGDDYGYGVSYTSVSADYKYQYQDGENDELSVMLKFPQPVVGIAVKANPDSLVAFGTHNHVFDITGNDNFARRLFDDNYNVMPEVVLIDANGNPADKNGDGNYEIDHQFYKAVLAKGSNGLEFMPKAGASGSYDLYYQIRLNATKTGGTPPGFALSSQVMKVTVFVMDTDTLVYYEKYDDDTYGFYAGDSVPVPQGLDNIKRIAGSGYGVLSASAGKTVQLGDGAATGDFIRYGGTAYLYTIDAAAVSDAALREVKFGDAGADDPEVLGEIHPNFAKAVYAAVEADEDETGGDTEDETGAEDETGPWFLIRTPLQMANISQLAENSEQNETKGVTFVQERDLDFRTLVATAGTTASAAGAAAAGTEAAVATAGTTAVPAAAPIDAPIDTAEDEPADGEPADATADTLAAAFAAPAAAAAELPLVLDNAVVTGIFEGTFTVADSGSAIPYAISHVNIVSERDNIGLFSQNGGVIKGISLRPDTIIKGRDHTGGIAGHNMSSGLIEACTVEGWEDVDREGVYIGMHIEGRENVGGIAGLNDGEIKDCAVQNTTETVSGYDYVGGIAGLNGSGGTISGAIVSNVALEYEHDPDHCGALTGGNTNAAQNSVTGQVLDVTMERVQLETGEEDEEEAEGAEAEARQAPKGDEDKKEPEEPLDMKEPDEAEDLDTSDESGDADGAGESADVATAGTTAGL